MQKKTLLLVIDNLVKGGAEVMLVNLLPELSLKYKIIIVTLTDKSEFEEKEIICDYQYSLGFKNKLSIISSILTLKKIIKRHQPSLIHTHLIYSSLIARIACPAAIPLLYSIHGELSKSDFNNSKVLTFLEKNTIRKNHSLIAVSEVALRDYEKTIFKVPNSYILHNFISDNYFNQQAEPKNFSNIPPLKFVAVGNIKVAKNYGYLINTFTLLKDFPVTLDIFGNTNHGLFENLQLEITRNKLNVSFKGACNNVIDHLNNYDLFVMSSKNEGFGIAVIEAMASGLPVIVPSIPVMKEITSDNALFFNLNDPHSLFNLIKEFLEGEQPLNELSLFGLNHSKQFNRKDYLKKLLGIYAQITE